MKKLVKWNDDVKRGLDYVLGLHEKEQQKTETIEETKARHRTMAETALLTMELLKQCTTCKYYKDPAKCHIHNDDEIDVNCPDWAAVQKEGEQEDRKIATKTEDTE